MEKAKSIEGEDPEVKEGEEDRCRQPVYNVEFHIDGKESKISGGIRLRKQVGQNKGKE